MAGVDRVGEEGFTGAASAGVWAGRVLSGVAVAFLLFDASGKLLRVAPVIEGSLELGYPESAVVPIGVLLLLGVVMYVVPKTAVLGAIYLAAYLGGAVAAHFRLGNPLATHVLFPVYVAAFVWGGLALRRPRLMAVLWGGGQAGCRSRRASNDDNSEAVHASQQRRTPMADPRVQPIPEGAHSLTPHLVCAGAAHAIDFYVRAFGAVEEFRLPDPAGRIAHACVRIGDSRLMLVDEFPEHGNLGPKALHGSPVTIHHFVEDVDAAVRRAVEAGARLTLPPTDMFWGDRYATLEDPFGHRWSLATHQRDLSPEQIREAMAKGAG